MTAKEIISALAADKGVEKMVSVVCSKRSNAVNLQDLTQDVYLAILEKEPEFVEKAYQEGWFGWWVLGLVKRLSMPKSVWSYTLDKWGEKNMPITEDILQLPDE